MSDRVRKAVGLILLLTGLLLVTLPLLKPTDQAKRYYRAAGNRNWIPKEIRAEQNGSVRVNEADAETLQLLPGIGPAYAERIITERQKNGPFHYPEDLEAVRGIGPQVLAGFRNMLDMTTDEGGN